ncbi:MAG TPA: TIGR03067 domain-containing protein [Gemmataceae bacterium]|nr:TIGR03067 domain-containing protein [Gemmataceae bacterium]
MNLMMVLAAGLLVAADDDAKKKELEKMQGTWQVVGVELDGKKQPQAEVEKTKLRLTIKGNKYVYKAGDTEVSEGSFEIDTTKDPKTIDASGTTKTGKVEKTIGIYEFKGDTMRVCLVPAGEERPKEFATKADSKAAVMEYKRAK